MVDEQYQQPVQAQMPQAGVPVQTPQQVVPVKKKSRWWIWLIVVVVVIGLGVGVYLLISNEPSFPEEISGYQLDSKPYVSSNSFFKDPECINFEGEQVCVRSARIEYYNEVENKSVHFLPKETASGDFEGYIDSVKNDVYDEKVAPGVYRGKEEWELFWQSKKYPLIVIQEYDYKTSIMDRASINNPVVEYFLDKYPPIGI